MLRAKGKTPELIWTINKETQNPANSCAAESTTKPNLDKLEYVPQPWVDFQIRLWGVPWTVAVWARECMHVNMKKEDKLCRVYIMQ